MSAKLVIVLSTLKYNLTVVRYLNGVNFLKLMTEYFQANLPKAFAEVERRFNQFREGFEEELLADLFSLGLTPVDVPEGYHSKKSLVGEVPVNSRVAISLGNGYIMKVRPWRGRNFDYTHFEPNQNLTQKYIEEDNVKTLRKYGFTTENGFLVPEHKVIGIHLVDGRIKVNTEGYGVTITEDLSDGGNYEVVDFRPQLLIELQNGDALRTDYQRHIQTLFDLYNHPKIKATDNRHGQPDNPKESIDRMLMVMVKEGIGKLAVADLDNLVFDEVTDH